MEKNAQVLLINFTEAEAQQVTKAGFNVDVGNTYENDSGVFLWVPRPAHEYDVYVYNSAAGAQEFKKSTPSPIHLQQNSKFRHEICDLTSFPTVRIAFVGEVSMQAECLIGTFHVNITKAHDNVSIVLPIDIKHPQAIEDLQTLLERSVGQVKLPVKQYLIPNESASIHPYNFIPVFTNRNGDCLAAYSASYKRPLPSYIVLPQYNNNTLMLIKLLELFAQIQPRMFPDYSGGDWEEGSEFWNPREQQLHAEISAVEKEAELIVSNKKKELISARNELGFIRSLLTALETSETTPEERLSTVVKKTLVYLGFEVTDIDETIASAIRKEDLWIRDDGFIAIGEVNGTQKKNPKRTEYNDLLGRMNTIFKRRDLIPDASNITGLLILNYDSKTHPDRRPTLYSGEDSDISKAAAESDIGILSTVELYKLARAVQFGTLSKENARAQIKTFGLIKAHS